MDQPRTHHLPRPALPFRPSSWFEVPATRRVAGVAPVVAVAALSGVGLGVVMPRGPVTSAQALVLLLTGVIVGFVSGLILRSRWAMLLAPSAQILSFELVRLEASGPTVDGISIDGVFGPLAFVVGRGFYGLVSVLPMVVTAAYGAAVARRSEPVRRRRLRSRIGLYGRRGVAVLASLAVFGLAYLLVRPASVPPIRDASGHVVPGSIASLEKVRINGSDQWIEIRAWSPEGASIRTKRQPPLPSGHL